MKTVKEETAGKQGIVIAMVMSDFPTGRSNDSGNSDREHGNRSGKEQPTNNKPATGQRGEGKHDERTEQKAAGRQGKTNGSNRSR